MGVYQGILEGAVRAAEEFGPQAERALPGASESSLNLLKALDESRYTKGLGKLAGNGKQSTVPFGDGRTYEVYQPAGAQTVPMKTMLVLHSAGFTKAPMNVPMETGMNIKADLDNFLVIYPQAMPRPIPSGLLKGVMGDSWNVSNARNMTKPTWNNYSDVDYLDKVIADATKRFNVDGRNISMVGMSDGGRMAQRYASDRPGTLSAIASVNGTIMGDEVKIASNAPLPAVMLINSIPGRLPWQQDLMVPAQGGVGWASGMRIWGGMFEPLKDSRPTGEQIAFWLRDANAPRITETVNNVTHTVIDNGGQPLEQYLIKGAQHAWHGKIGKGGLPLIGMRTKDFEVTDLVKEFLLKHRLPDGTLDIQRSLATAA